MPMRKKWYHRMEEMEAQKTRFIEYVDRTVATWLLPAKRVFTFRFYAGDVDDSVMDCFQNSLAAAKSRTAMKLDLQLYGVARFYSDFTLSPSVTFLKLAIWQLNGLTFSMAKCLRVISLGDARFLDEEMMKNLEKDCPLLEDLRLLRCPRLTRLEISSLVHLRRVEVQDCREMRCIQIVASSLETFWYHYHAQAYKKCEVDLKGSKNLRILTLKDRLMSEYALKHCISLCSFLEKLELQECNRMKKLTICSLTLKSLTLIDCKRLTEVDIDAPSLYSFEYTGYVIPFPFAHASSCLSEVTLYFKPNAMRGSKLKFDNFFGNFDGSKGFRLAVYTRQNMKIFEEPKKSR